MKPRTSTVFFILFLTAGLCACSSDRTLLDPEESVRVANVVDGDTIKLKDGRIVRLIGVDCPELHDDTVNTLNAARLGMTMAKQADYARKAHDYVRGLTRTNPIKLGYDPAYEVLKNQDRSGRVLAYVYSGEALVNAELIKLGYCTIYSKVTFSKRKEFEEYEKEARAARIGIWEKSKNIF